MPWRGSLLSYRSRQTSQRVEPGVEAENPRHRALQIRHFVSASLVNRAKALNLAANTRGFPMSEVDNGGLDNMSTAKLMLVELIYRDTGFLDKSDRRTFRILRDDPKLKNNPAALAKLYQYRTTLVTCLTKNLQLLGLERVPDKPKTLDELFEEQSHDQQQSDSGKPLALQLKSF